MNENDMQNVADAGNKFDKASHAANAKRRVIGLLGAITLCGFAFDASAKIHSDNVQSANATLSDCVVLNVGTTSETVTSITIWYYDEELHPHVLTQTTTHQVVHPGDAVYVQDGYSVPRSEGLLVPSTSCSVATSDDAAFRAVFELRDKNGNTVINEPLR
jgi:hypothetical protein